MFTTHNLHEIQITSRPPLGGDELPRELVRELGPDGVAVLIRDFRRAEATRRGRRRAAAVRLLASIRGFLAARLAGVWPSASPVAVTDADG